MFLHSIDAITLSAYAVIFLSYFSTVSVFDYF